MTAPAVTAPTPPAAGSPPPQFNLRTLLQEMLDRKASDLHITAGVRAKMRIDGEMEDSQLEMLQGAQDQHELTPRMRSCWVRGRKEPQPSLSAQRQDEAMELATP